ncbi:hypothetical protein FPSE_10816 [Fusarium pseudograminearum CS3096]|uniref:Uncharacterized protein n=1 Tax=Fusarium pseudograminearum (strain CS3096) TaxID=1028729 RepID=K3VA47_FUSPC|nr:hypothetical protein FPSE_10816 [Fusarium pseudograminearum CS3096]EKJ69003.1 hypothetical protein FPSE_10816 [Fusarium pseudograminearum CS3096]
MLLTPLLVGSLKLFLVEILLVMSFSLIACPLPYSYKLID